VYPNPTNGAITINADSRSRGEIGSNANQKKTNTLGKTLNVYTSNGTLIKSIKLDLNDRKISINLNEYPSGIYFIEITDGNFKV
jgi:hypothetical protein